MDFAGSERFDGVIIIIVGPNKAPDLFNDRLTRQGFRPIYVGYEQDGAASGTPVAPPEKAAKADLPNVSLANQLHLLSGIYKKGHNIMEPRPRQSKFIKMREAGLLVSSAGEAYYAEIEISDQVEKPYFLRVMFENPADSKNPFIEESEITNPPPYISMRHGPVKGLKINSNYSIIVEIFRRKADTKALDTVSQPVRSYLDTTGPVTKVKNGLAQ